MAATEKKEDRGKEKESEKDKKDAAAEQASGGGGGTKRLIFIIGGTVGLLVVGLIVFMVLKSLGGKEQRGSLDKTYGEVKTLKLVVVVNKTRANALKDFICEVQFVFGKPYKILPDGTKEKFDKPVTAAKVEEFSKFMKDNESFLRERVLMFLQAYDDKALSENPSGVIEELKKRLREDINKFTEGLETAEPPEMLRDINVPMFKFQP
jgi:flagellar basal body-associated protein FliL